MTKQILKLIIWIVIIIPFFVMLGVAIVAFIDGWRGV